MKNSGSKKIADRYVTAVFAVATSENSVANVEKDLLTLAELLKENADFKAFLHNPLLSRDVQAEIASVVLKKIGVHDLTLKFVSMLAKQNRLDLLNEIIELYVKKAIFARGELSVELVSAMVVSDAEILQIVEKLNLAYNKKIKLTLRTDANLLGGAVINIGSTQLDSSVAGKLNRLQLALKAA